MGSPDKVAVAAGVSVSVVVMLVAGVLLVIFLLTRCHRRETSTVSPCPYYTTVISVRVLMLLGSRKNASIWAQIRAQTAKVLELQIKKTNKTNKPHTELAHSI